ncbi:MAG: 2,3-diphosphoglycerate-dependent phosphoglycerate mutase [Rhizomicrobium sp.]
MASDYKDYQLVIVRHGESEWNKLNLFTGWRDVKLSEQGTQEARGAGKTLLKEGFSFDIAYTSLLTRAIHTLYLAEEEMGCLWLPVKKHWRLNERHYGALQGQNKLEAVEKFGDEQVKIWRRSYDVPPPPVETSSPDYPRADRRYAEVAEKDLPRSESLKDVLARVMPFWEEFVLPDLKAGKRVLIAAHGNSLRALLKYLEGVSDEDIIGVDLPTGFPKAYRLNAEYKAADAKFVGDQAELERRINAVKAQTKKA